MNPAGIAPDDGRKTEVKHWDRLWTSPVTLRLPSTLHINTRNLQRLLRPHLKPRMTVLEIGCAPGKTLAWAASVTGGKTTGLDLSENGLAWCRRLFSALSLEGDFRCEDIFRTSLSPGSFDLVYSLGVIEHFDDPRDIVEAHLSLARPGGRVIVAVPNFGGFQGRLMKRLAPDAALLHNFSIMSPDALLRLVPRGRAHSVKAYRAGRFSLWHCGFERLRPRVAGTALMLIANAIGIAQPFDLPGLCPLLVLDITRDNSDL